MTTGHKRSRHVPRPVQLIPSPEPAPFTLYIPPRHHGGIVLKQVKPCLLQKPPTRLPCKSTGIPTGPTIDSALKPVKPGVHPSVVSWMEMVFARGKKQAEERIRRQEEARRVREEARTENVYTELHLMELINEHTGNKYLNIC